MSLSRRQFCQQANPNSDRFCSNLPKNEICDPSVIWLSITTWNPYKFIQFATLCRLLLNFALKRIVLIIGSNTNEFNTTTKTIMDSIFDDPFFISMSRIKQPKSNIMIHRVSQKHLTLHPHHLLNKFSAHKTDHQKLQIIIVHSNSVSFTSLSSPSSSPSRRFHSQPFIYHNLCHTNSFKSQLTALHALNHSLRSKRNTDISCHFFHMNSNDKSLTSHSQPPRVSFISFVTFALYSYRFHIPLFDHGTKQNTLEMKQMDAHVKDERYQCIPVLFEWKDPHNIGRLIHLSRMFKISVFIHLFDYHKMNLYHNHAFITKMMRECGVESMEKWKSMIDIKVISDATVALEMIHNAKSCNKAQVCVLIMNSALFLKLLHMDQERGLLIMETVKFGNKMDPISLKQWMSKRNQPNGALGGSKSYGIVGRENYGIKPKYLYDLYRIYDHQAMDIEKKTEMDACHRDKQSKTCEVVYVQTSHLLPSLNACTAMSLLIWANYWLNLQLK